MSLVDAASVSAAWTWHSLRTALAQRRTLKEESITDFFLLELIELTRGAVQVVDFTRRQEGKNGADWEWWFVDAGRYSLPFRVQAKVVDLKRANAALNPRYDFLHYAGRGHAFGHQTELLIREATAARMLPLYCLYTYFEPAFAPAVARCALYPSYRESFGISLIGAHAVAATTSTSLHDLFPDVHGFECLFRHAASLVSVQDYCLRRWGVVTSAQSFNAVRLPAEMPSYVSQMLDSNEGPDELLLTGLSENVERVTVLKFSPEVMANTTLDELQLRRLAWQSSLEGRRWRRGNGREQ